MTDNHCPHTMRIGTHEARITALEENSKAFETTIEGKINALKIIEDKASQSGFIKGIHVTATLIGYAIIIIGLLMAGKFTGAVEAALKFFTAIK